MTVTVDTPTPQVKLRTTEGGAWLSAQLAEHGEGVTLTIAHNWGDPASMTATVGDLEELAQACRTLIKERKASSDERNTDD